MRLSIAPLVLCTLFCTFPFTAQADTAKEADIHCAAFYEWLSVAGDQPDISRKQASKGFSALLTRAGDSPETQEAVAQKMVEIGQDIPGPLTPEKVARLRAKHEPQCKPLMKAAWCEVFKDPSACAG